VVVRQETSEIPDNGKLQLAAQPISESLNWSPVRVRILLYTLAAVVYLADQASKLWVVTNLGHFQEVVVIPGFFHLVHVRNTGAAFGMLADAPAWLRATVLVGISSFAMLALAWFLWKTSATNRYGGSLLRLGLALVLGGAAGNMHDRLLHGNVVDFLDFFIGSWHWYTFNIADSAICVGTGLLLIDMWRKPATESPHASETH
jgi:signal peptidase II